MYNYRIIFSDIISDQLKCLAWCQRNGLIMEGPGCRVCGRVMNLYAQKNKNADFKCIVKTGTNPHRVKMSILKNSWFESARQIDRIVLLCYMFSVGDTSYLRMKKELSSEEVSISMHTINDWLVHCREVVLDWCLSNQAESLGGPGKVVFVHRSKIMAHKFRKINNVAKDAWLFELVDLGGDDLDDSEFKFQKFKLFFSSDDSFDTETLLPYLKDFILPNTVLLSDLWRNKYYFLGENTIRPYQVQEKKRVSETDGAQINWQKIKSRLNTGIQAEHYVYEFIWRRFAYQNKLDNFEFFINCIKKLYNPYANDNIVVTPVMLSSANSHEGPLRKKLKSELDMSSDIDPGTLQTISDDSTDDEYIPVEVETILQLEVTEKIVPDTDEVTD